MSKEKKYTKNSFVTYNSLISLSLISDQGQSFHLAKYIVRMENLEETLILKSCKTPLVEYSDLIESFFFIRDIDECQTIYSSKKTDNSINSQIMEKVHNNLKEIGFHNSTKLNFNHQFYLQHMMSRKFITIEKSVGKENFSLKLTNHIEKAVPFSFKKINDSRSSLEFITFKTIVYLTIYNKENGRFYYINSSYNTNSFNKFLMTNDKDTNNDETDIIGTLKKKKKEKNKEHLVYSELFIGDYISDVFYIVDQSWIINNKQCLYSGQLINIVFANNKTKENEQLMLATQGIKEAKKTGGKISVIKEEVREDIDVMLRESVHNDLQGVGATDRIKENANLYASIQVKGIPYQKELYEHVIQNSFWVIETEFNDDEDKFERKPIKIGEYVRIKNPLFGLYLHIKKKDKEKEKHKREKEDNQKEKNSKELSEIISDNHRGNNLVNDTNNINMNDEFEFELVSEESMKSKAFFDSNFQFFHYNINEENKDMVAGGKYVLKSVFKDINAPGSDIIENFDLNEMESYFQPILLTTDDNENIEVKNEDDFFLDIRKIDIYEGGQVIYLQKIIVNLDYIIKNYNKKFYNVKNVIKTISPNISFLVEYLLNLDYSFKDDNFDMNNPIKERQMLLDKFGILNTIQQIIDYFIPLVKEILEKKKKNHRLSIDNNNLIIQSFVQKIGPSQKFQKKDLKNQNSIITDIQNLLKNILKFLIYLSDNNEDIKQKIFIDLKNILELSEFLFPHERSPLLEFIFKIIDNSESLQEFILGSNLRLSEQNRKIIDYRQYERNEAGIADKKLIRIETIFRYIETSNNYLFFYKKLLNLNKVKYKYNEIKDKIIDHMKRMNSKASEDSENYKCKISRIVDKVKKIIKSQLKLLNDKKRQNGDLIDETNSKGVSSKENNDISNNNSIHPEINNNEIENKKKEDLNDIGSSSNDYLNQTKKPAFGLGNAHLKIPLQKKFKSQYFGKKKEIKEEEDSKILLRKSITKKDNMNGEGGLKNDDRKKTQDEFAANLQNETNLRNILVFLKYFENFDIDKSLFIQEVFFEEIFGQNEKIEYSSYLENRLNFLINGEITSSKIINNLNINFKSRLGSLFPLRLYNMFFPKIDYRKEQAILKGEEELVVPAKKGGKIDIINEEKESISNDNESKRSKSLDRSNEENKSKSSIMDSLNFEDDSPRGKYLNDQRKKNNFEIQNISASIQKDNKEKANSSRKRIIFEDEEEQKDKVGEEEKIESSFRRRDDNKNNLSFVRRGKEGVRGDIKHKTLSLGNINFKRILELKKIQDTQVENEGLDVTKLNKYLCILYCSYQFCINQYIEVIYKLYNILSNHCINFENFAEIERIPEILLVITKNLLAKIKFIDNSVMDNIYKKAGDKPSLLEKTFDIENFYANKNEYYNKAMETSRSNRKSSMEKIGLGRDSIKEDLNENKKQNNNNNNRLKVLTPEEANLIKFLMYYCQKIDEINYVCEKMECFKGLRKITRQESLKNKKIDKKVNNESYIENATVILKKILSKRCTILELYEKLNIVKNKFVYSLKDTDDSLNGGINYEVYGVDRRSDFIIKLLEQYEIENFFDKIIYLELKSDKNAITPSALYNLDLCQKNFKFIEGKIKEIKEKNENKPNEYTSLSTEKNRVNLQNKSYYIEINERLKEMTKSSLNIFNTEDYKFDSSNKLILNLMKENENFYEKIGFANTLSKMVEAIDYYSENDENPLIKLQYCVEILRIFIDVQNIFPQFYKLVPENFNKYIKMITKSLKCVIEFPLNKTNENEEKLFLTVCFFSSESFLFVIKNCRLPFNEMNSSILEVFDILMKIYIKFNERSTDINKVSQNQIIYQIFYNYLVTRVLIFLNKDKNYDANAYELFFKKIYPYKRMSEQVIKCIDELTKIESNETNNDKLINDNEDEEEEEKEGMSEKDKENEENEDDEEEDEEEEKANPKNKDLQKKKNNFILNFQNKKDQFKLKHRSQSKGNEISNVSKKNSGAGGIDSKLYSEKEMTFDESNIYNINDEEKEKLGFFLSYLTIYIIYLNDKNSLKIRNENSSGDEHSYLEFDFKSISNKIKNFFDKTIIIEDNFDKKINYNQYKIDEEKSSSFSPRSSFFSQRKMTQRSMYTLEDEEKNVRRKSIIKMLNNITNSKVNDSVNKTSYLFESVLLESIVGYKYFQRGKNCEIAVKKSQKIANSPYHRNTNVNNEPDRDTFFESKNDNKLITFYYYENEYVDIILLEKVFQDIEIKPNIRYYCINNYTNELDDALSPSALLKQLIKMQKQFDLIADSADGEYLYMHNLFIKNEMESLLINLFNHFDENDLNRIDIMKNFIYKRMIEIYPEINSDNNELQFEQNLCLVEELKSFEDKYRKNKFRIEHSFINMKIEEKRSQTKASTGNLLELRAMNILNEIDLFTFFNSMIYLYPKYNKKLCLIFYRIGFQLLIDKSKISDNEKISPEAQGGVESSEKELNISSILHVLILIFSRKSNQELIISKQNFYIILSSLCALLGQIKENHNFIIKNFELIQELFHKLDFILENLLKDFQNIVLYMKSPESQKMTSKYEKMEKKLKILISFISTLLGFKKVESTIMTNEITSFGQIIVEQLIKLLFVLLEINNVNSFKTINILLEFIYYFIDGPDIENLITLFSFGYFDLLTFMIQKIDYYKLLLSNINKTNVHQIIDNIAEIEQQVFKIFFVYYNVVHTEHKNIVEFSKLRHWYEDNIHYIKIKLKKLYYLSKKEMDNRVYDIDKMLLFLKYNDNYDIKELFQRAGFNLSDYNIQVAKNANSIDNNNDIKNHEKSNNKNKINIDDNNNNYENTNEKNTNINNNLPDDDNDKIENDEDEDDDIDYKNEKSKYCLIKFDLLLLYYTLYNYHQDSINDGYLEVPVKRTLFIIIKNLFKNLLYFIVSILISIIYFVYYIYRACSVRIKSDIELLQELSKIESEYQTVDEKEMFQFLTARIKSVEVKLNGILYKIYFPLLSKAKLIQEKSELFLKVDSSQLSNYVIHIMSNYDKINIKATQNIKIDKIFKLPIICIIFAYTDLYSVLLIILGIAINIMIGLSYSNFTTESCDGKKDPKDIRVSCPHFLYKSKSTPDTVKRTLLIIGLCLFILQMVLFLDYILRKITVTYGVKKIDYQIGRIKKKKNMRNLSVFSYINIIISTIGSCLFNFQTFYYLASISLVMCGIIIHPFFYCFILLELVNKVEVMKKVLKAMYEPASHILITLLMFILLEYAFSLFAVSLFYTHFPNVDDTKNFLKTFMRMLDQTFKQDGGIGTYLDQSKDPNYVPYTLKSYAGIRFWFDLIFFLVILLLIFQMFLSIIIDYFTQTRENDENFQKMSETKCLICGLERENLEKIYSNLKNAFDLHTHHCHNIIDYISYLIYLQALKVKDPIIDEAVWKLHLSNNYSYLPKGICFKLNETKCWKKRNQKS